MAIAVLLLDRPLPRIFEKGAARWTAKPVLNWTTQPRHPNAAAVDLDERLCDRQTEADAALLLRPPKAFPDPLELLG